MMAWCPRTFPGFRWPCYSTVGVLTSFPASHSCTSGSQRKKDPLLAGGKFPGSQALNFQHQFSFLLVGNQPILGDLELQTAVLVAGGRGKGVEGECMAHEEGLSLFESWQKAGMEPQK